MKTKYSIEELFKRKKRKQKYYQEKKLNNECLYGIGGELRVSNTIDRPKRRYGFKRYSVKQKHRVEKNLLRYKKSLNKQRIRCYTLQSYLSVTEINRLYRENKFSRIYEILFLSYINLDLLLEDYNYEFRDNLFRRVWSLCQLQDKDNLSLFKENYYDLLMDALLQFMQEKENFIDSKDTSFYAYIVNVIPYRISTLYYTLQKHNERICTELDAPLVQETSFSTCVNPLGIYLLHKLNFNFSEFLINEN